MMKNLRQPLFVLVLVLGAGVVGWYFIPSEKSPSLPVLPTPNGYDDFVKAGEMLSSDELPGFQELNDMDEAVLRTVLTNSLSSHAEALVLARVGLNRTCRVRLDYSATSGVHLSELSAIKRLSRVFITLGRLAELEGRVTAASEFYLDLIRLGHESARGGKLLDSMSGCATEAVGIGYLEKLAPKLDAQACHASASTLEAIDRRSEPIEAIIRQEKEWLQRTSGLRGQFLRLLNYRSLKRAEQAWAGRMKTQQTRRQSLVIKLAARAHELDTGKMPENLDQLVPRYLRRVPEGLSSKNPASYPLETTD